MGCTGLYTERLLLRHWEEGDAESLFKYAKDPDVGPIAGWPAHRSVAESRDVIKNVLNGKEAYAICLKDEAGASGQKDEAGASGQKDEVGGICQKDVQDASRQEDEAGSICQESVTGVSGQKDEAGSICQKAVPEAIGAIELKLNGHTDLTERDDECELGYWIGKPFWGRGLMPEAVKEMLRHAFEDCGMQKVWIGYYEGNNKSKRVQEKCGFKFQWRAENVDVPLMHEKRTGYVSLMTKEDWLSLRRTDLG